MLPMLAAVMHSCEGVATSIQLHGPGSELHKCKETFDGFGTAYFEADSGFSCIT